MKIKIKGSSLSKRSEDAGYDIYGVPTRDELLAGSYCFKPGELRMIPTGLKTEFPKGYVGIIKERGSTGSKGLAVRCGVIDSGYRGEWFIGIINVTNEVVYYPTTKAIAQVVFVQHEELELVEGELEESERGEGKLGSSGK